MTERKLNDHLISPFLNERINRELRRIFVDFVLHGRPRRDIDGANGMKSCASDDISVTTICYLEPTSSNYRRFQKLSWVPLPQDASRSVLWDKMNRRLERLWEDATAAARNENNTCRKTRWEIDWFRHNENDKLELARFSSDDLVACHHVCIENSIMDLALLAKIALLAVSRSHSRIEDLGYCGMAFVNRFAGHWPGFSWTQWCCKSDPYCHMQFHVRYLRLYPAGWVSSPNCEGILIQRKSMVTPFPDSDGFKLRESRIATCVSSMVNAKPASFSTVTLRDHGAGELHDLRSPRAREDVQDVMPANNCGCFLWAAEFQVGTDILLHEWQQGWNNTLGYIYRIVTQEFRLRDCRIYRQWLQVSEEYIWETVADIRHLRSSFERCFPSAPGQIKANWDSLVERQRERAWQLYSRAREIRHIVTEQEQELTFQSHLGRRDAQCLHRSAEGATDRQIWCSCISPGPRCSARHCFLRPQEDSTFSLAYLTSCFWVSTGSKTKPSYIPIMLLLLSFVPAIFWWMAGVKAKTRQITGWVGFSDLGPADG